MSCSLRKWRAKEWRSRKRLQNKVLNHNYHNPNPKKTNYNPKQEDLSR
jgi:hypothetical protein